MKKPLVYIPALRQRANMPELMDDKNGDPQLLANTLTQFRLINRLLTPVRRLLKKHVVAYMRQEPNREYHLVDLGAGGCETAAWLLGYAQRQSCRLRITACDHDSRMVQYARENFGETPGLTICHRNALEIDELRPVDFVFGNHFLHHLDAEDLPALLSYLASMDEAKLILSDIHRNLSAYVGFSLISAMLFRNSFARYDGLLSIRKGFTEAELTTLADETIPHGTTYRVQRMTPGHIVLLVR